jgi:hypothetical protein
MTNTVNTVAATVGDEIKSFRSAAVTSENRSTPLARSLLASVVSGTMTVALLESAALVAYGNPKNAKGKPIATVSGLRNCIGGTAFYQTWKSFVSLVETIDGDAPVTDADGTTVGNGSIRKAIVGFILGNEDAPRNLKQLLAFRDDALKAFYALTMPAPDAATDDAAKEPAAAVPAAGNGEISQLSLLDRVNALLVAIAASDDAEFDAAYDALATVPAAINARIEAQVATGHAVELESEAA